MRPDGGSRPASEGPVDRAPADTFGITARTALALVVALWAAPVWGQTDPDEASGGIEELGVEPSAPPTEQPPAEQPPAEQPDVEDTGGQQPIPAAVESPDGAPEGAEASQRTPLSGEYVLRLQELEDRVNDLKEEIFRSKSRLVLLRERVLRTTLGGTQAVISHVNDMSPTFDLDQVIYSLDGNQIFAATREDGMLADSDVIEIYNGAIVPGPHNVSVEMIFVGNGFGLFTYLEGYRFRLRSSHAFDAEEGKITYLNVVAYEQGGVNQPIEERPDIRYELEFSDSVLDDVAAD